MGSPIFHPQILFWFSYISGFRFKIMDLQISYVGLFNFEFILGPSEFQILIFKYFFKNFRFLFLCSHISRRGSSTSISHSSPIPVREVHYFKYIPVRPSQILRISILNFVRPSKNVAVWSKDIM